MNDYGFRVQFIPDGSAADSVRGFSGFADEQDGHSFQVCVHAELFTDLVMILSVQGHGGRGNDLHTVAQGSRGNRHVLGGQAAVEVGIRGTALVIPEDNERDKVLFFVWIINIKIFHID